VTFPVSAPQPTATGYWALYGISFGLNQATQMYKVFFWPGGLVTTRSQYMAAPEFKGNRLSLENYIPLAILDAIDLAAGNGSRSADSVCVRTPDTAGFKHENGVLPSPEPRGT
jgi:hypothetical protein